jgi:hypothetical protein
MTRLSIGERSHPAAHLGSCDGAKDRVNELAGRAQLRVAAEHRAGVGEALHLELERVDALREQQIVGVDLPA